jgi:hypothetical protein
VNKFTQKLYMRSNLKVDDKDLRFKLTSSYARQISEERMKQNDQWNGSAYRFE